MRQINDLICCFSASSSQPTLILFFPRAHRLIFVEVCCFRNCSVSPNPNFFGTCSCASTHNFYYLFPFKISRSKCFFLSLPRFNRYCFSYGKPYYCLWRTWDFSINRYVNRLVQRCPQSVWQQNSIHPLIMGRAMVTSLWAWMGLALRSRGNGTSNAEYDPVGAIASRNTYESGVALGFGGTRTFLTSGGIGATSGWQTNSNVEITASSFTSGGLSFHRRHHS